MTKPRIYHLRDPTAKPPPDPHPRHTLCRVTDPERWAEMKAKAAKRRRLYLIMDRAKALGLTR